MKYFGDGLGFLSFLLWHCLNSVLFIEVPGDVFGGEALLAA